MAPTRDPVLTVWQAMNLLDEVHVQSDFPETSSLLVEAEIALLNLVLSLARCDKLRSSLFEARVITNDRSLTPIQLAR
jgi:hypothetical protein